MDRRSFIKRSGIVGAASVLGPAVSSAALKKGAKESIPDICIVNGEDVFENTRLLIEKLGGMSRFVKPGKKVGLLVNSEFVNRGAYVSPDMTLAVAKMCFDAGASEVRNLQMISDRYWGWTPLSDKYPEVIENLVNNEYKPSSAVFDPEHFSRVEVPGKSLKQAEVVNDFFTCDVYINIAIAKHHGSSIYTGILKNTMGINTRENCVTFHRDGPARNDPDFLAQCIADLNLLRKADLSVVDVSEVLVTNGPSGPGDVIEPRKVVAGTDMVAVDHLCTTLIGHEYGDILTIKKGYENGLGEMDFRKLDIAEIHPRA